MKMLEKFLKTSLIIIAFMFVSNFSFGAKAANWTRFYTNWWNRSATTDYKLELTGMITVGADIGVPAFGGDLIEIYGTDASLHGFNGQNLYKGFNLNNRRIVFKDITFNGFMHDELNGGGAIYANSSTITFLGKINFSNNNNNYSGAIYAIDNSSINFSGTIVNFTNNSARKGGAIYANGGTNVNFSGTTINFTNNVAAVNDGGAIYASGGADINFSGTIVNFTNNSARSYAGAIWAVGGVNVKFSRSAVNFIDNSATNLGAITLGNNSVLSFINSDVIFSGNTVGNKPNDIYMDSGAILIFDVEKNNKVELFGGIVTGSNGNNSITKTGIGNMRLGGINNSSVSFNVERGTLTLTADSGYLGKLKISANAVLSMVDGSGFAKNGNIVDTLEINGVLNIGIYTGWISDMITAVNDITINPKTSSLTVSVYDIGQLPVEGVTVPIFKLLNGDKLAYKFSNSKVLGSNRKFIIRTSSDDTKIVYLHVRMISEWDAFVESFRDDFTNITLTEDIKATNTDMNIGTRTAVNIITIDGQEHILNADNLKSGFELINRTFIFKDITFVGFKGEKFGVIHSSFSTVNIDDAMFYDNEVRFGGAIYIAISTVTIRAMSRDVIFSGNKSDGLDNDIDVDSDSVLNLYARQGLKIEMNGGITGTDDNNIVRKTGKGKLILDGITKFEGKMIIEEGAMKVKASSITLGTLEILDDGILDVDWEVDNTNLPNVIIGQEVIIENQAKVKLNVFKNPKTFGSSQSIIYTVERSGEFVDISAGRHAYKFQWLSQSGVINGHQYEKIGNVIYIGKYVKGVFLANVISNSARPIGVESLYERIKVKNKKGSKVWGELYGQGFQLNEDENSIGKFKEQGFGARAGLDIYTNEDSMIGLYMRYGINSMEQERDKAGMKDFELGLYGKLFQSENIRVKGILSFGTEQFDTKSEMYLFVGENPNINIPTQKASFYTKSIKIGGQAEYIIAKEKIEIKPFIGLQGGYVRNGEIKEEGGGAADLQVSVNHYERLESLLGIGIGNKTNDEVGIAHSLIWNAKVYGGYLLIGDKPKYEVFYYKDSADIDGKFELVGAKREVIRGGLALRGEYLINDRVSIYGNLDTSFSKSESEYNVNAGIGYRFARIEPRKNDWKAQEKAKAKAQAREMKKVAAQEKIVAEAQVQEMKKQIAQEKAIEKEKAKIEKKRTVKELKQIEEYEIQETFKKSRLKKSFKLSIAQFEPNQIELKQEYKDLIKEVAQEIIAQGYERVIIVGYRDKSETDHYHANLSRQRAMIVADEFIRNEIEEGKIEYVGFEEKMPIVINNKTGQTRNKNRSADIFVEIKD